jgi:predicted Zn-dependent protease
MRRYPTRRRRSRGRMGLSLRLIPIALFALYLLFYYFSNRETVPVTGRKQLVDISRDEEVALGLASYQDILSKSDLVRDGRNLQVIRQMGERLVGAARELGIDPGYEWEFNFIRSDQANAFALPGGKVAVYTGLIEMAQNEDGLSAVMGHEIAHAIARHGAERMAYQKLTRIGALAASFALGDLGYQGQKMIQGALGVGSQYGILLPFSRKHESEADRIGLLLLAQSCYDPREAPLLWERMGANREGQAPSEFASTHPSPQTRIEQFTQWMPEALNVYEQYCGSPPPS